MVPRLRHEHVKTTFFRQKDFGGLGDSGDADQNSTSVNSIKVKNAPIPCYTKPKLTADCFVGVVGFSYLNLLDETCVSGI